MTAPIPVGGKTNEMIAYSLMKASNNVLEPQHVELDSANDDSPKVSMSTELGLGGSSLV